MKDRLHIRIVQPIVLSAAGFILVANTALGGSGFHFASEAEKKAMRDEIYFPATREDTSFEQYSALNELVNKERRLLSDKDISLNELLDEEKKAVAIFVENTFAELPASKMKYHVDFNARISALKVISGFKAVKTDTNTLYSIADFIGRGIRLPTDELRRDLSELVNMRTRLCHTPEQIKAWETQPERYKCFRGDLMTKHVFPDFGRECVIEYTARWDYNRRLDEFRRHALRLFYKTISESAGFQNDWKSV